MVATTGPSGGSTASTSAVEVSVAASGPSGASSASSSTVAYTVGTGDPYGHSLVPPSETGRRWAGSDVGTVGSGPTTTGTHALAAQAAMTAATTTPRLTRGYAAQGVESASATDESDFTGRLAGFGLGFTQPAVNAPGGSATPLTVGRIAGRRSNIGENTYVAPSAWWPKLSRGSLIPASFFRLVTGRVFDESGNPLTTGLYIATTDNLPTMGMIDDTGRFEIYLLRMGYENFMVIEDGPEGVPYDFVRHDLAENVRVDTKDKTGVELKFDTRTPEPTDAGNFHLPGLFGSRPRHRGKWWRGEARRLSRQRDSEESS